MTAASLPPLYEPKAGRLTIQYAPVAAMQVVENPPRFSWLPVIEDEATYALRLCVDPNFPAKITTVFAPISLNFFTPDVALATGDYHWSYAVCDPETGTSTTAWSIPACIALLGDDTDDEARDWLSYSIEFLATVYSPWGDSDGGWAEGTHYWMMGIAYLIDSANRLKSYTGIDLYKRPFFQNTGDFALFCKAPNTRRGTFGDDSTMGDLPCVKTGLNLRQFAGASFGMDLWIGG